MLLLADNLEREIADNPCLRLGCVVDTNVVFAASFPLDTHNEWSEQVFEILHELDVPIFTNINVRSEFIDLNRRVLIPECLVDFYEDFSDLIDGVLESKLKSLKTRKKKANDENRTFKFSDTEIKEYKKMFEALPKLSGKSAWSYFCKEYLFGYIEGVWEKAENILKIKFLGAKEIEEATYFNGRPTWENMVKIVGHTGVGSADAMIINLFQESKFPLMITADKDVRDALLEFEPKEKFIVAP